MSSPPPTTTFLSRGRLTGVIRQRPAHPAPRRGGDLDTQAWEAVYYRARLILGDSLAPPAYLRARGR
jgi:hypothetical protein